jgi:hypothetical protein
LRKIMPTVLIHRIGIVLGGKDLSCHHLRGVHPRVCGQKPVGCDTF